MRPIARWFARIDHHLMNVEGIINDCRQELADGGFTVADLVGDELGCDWAYTIGLQRNYDHPELLVVGLDAPVAGAVLELAGARVAAGRRIEVGDHLTIDGGLGFRARAIDPFFASHGDWFNLGREVMSTWGDRWPTTVQLVWGDAGERPVGVAAEPAWPLRQPLLFDA